VADPDNVVLQHLRGIREVLDTVNNRVMELTQPIGGLEVQVANMSVRIDRIDARLDRVEMRLGLIEA
jgi:hypothetical protein